VREIDRISIGTGEPGPITRKLQAAFSAAAKDVPAAHPEWLAFL
jgi:branched-subunit amino acid aminotransferase/4-amino-4-deoxychorismate lyase